MGRGHPQHWDVSLDNLTSSSSSEDVDVTPRCGGAPLAATLRAPPSTVTPALPERRAPLCNARLGSTVLQSPL